MLWLKRLTLCLKFKKEKAVTGKNVFNTSLITKLYLIGFKYFEQNLETLTNNELKQITYEIPQHMS